MDMTCGECELIYDITGKTDWRCPQCQPKKLKKYREENKEQIATTMRRSHFKESYGITIEKYDEMLVAQGGGCAICGKKPTTRRLAVDHCHLTLKVRGLLCVKCNVGLGQFEADLVLIQKAVQYLERSKDVP